MTLIALHGHGDDPETARAWATPMLPPGWSLEVPVAQRDSTGSRSWFDSGPRGVDPRTLRASHIQVGEVVDRVRRSGGLAVVVGFSQGGAVALSLPPSTGLIGIVSICGFFPDGDDIEPESGPPTLLICGTLDEVVPSVLNADAARTLSVIGREVTSAELSGGHEVSGEAQRSVAAWFERRWPRRIQVSVHLPVDRVQDDPAFVSGAGIGALASAMEQAGADAVYVTDHPAPDSRWLAAGGHHALEPTVALTAAAMATRTLLLHTHVYVLGYRNPFLAAKAIASLDVISGGRVVLGVAAGYLRPEFAALGAEFEDRGAHLDASLELLPRIWSESEVAAQSSEYSARGVSALPRPIQIPHPPIWVGGNSRTAQRRAARLAQGWSPFPTAGGLAKATRTASIDDPEQLDVAIDGFETICREVGRSTRATICFAPFSASTYYADPDQGAGAMIQEIRGLYSRGVDWVTVSVPGTSCEVVASRAQTLLAELRAS